MINSIVTTKEKIVHIKGFTYKTSNMRYSICSVKGMIIAIWYRGTKSQVLLVTLTLVVDLADFIGVL